MYGAGNTGVPPAPPCPTVTKEARPAPPAPPFRPVLGRRWKKKAEASLAVPKQNAAGAARRPPLRLGRAKSRGTDGGTAWARIGTPDPVTTIRPAGAGVYMRAPRPPVPGVPA
jgi:hypothetical protein